MNFKYLENIAIADIAFEAWGKTLEEVFESSALATSETMVNTKNLKPKISKKISLENEKIDDLLYEFLSEIVFYKDAEQLFFGKFSIKIQKNQKYKLTAELYGEKINPKTQELRNDVKAVTLHMFELKRLGSQWKALVVLDI